MRRCHRRMVSGNGVGAGTVCTAGTGKEERTVMELAGSESAEMIVRVWMAIILVSLLADAVSGWLAKGEMQRQRQKERQRQGEGDAEWLLRWQFPSPQECLPKGRELLRRRNTTRGAEELPSSADRGGASAGATVLLARARGRAARGYTLSFFHPSPSPPSRCTLAPRCSMSRNGLTPPPSAEQPSA